MKNFPLYLGKKIEDNVGEYLPNHMLLDDLHTHLGTKYKNTELGGCEIFYNARMYSKALECFEKYLASHPENGEVWVDKGDTLFRMKSFMGAKNCYKTAIEINPDCIRAMINKGIVIFTESPESLINPLGALECFNCVLKIDPANVRAQKYKEIVFLFKWPSTKRNGGIDKIIVNAKIL